MGQNLLVQYSRSKFKQHNGTTTINNAMAPPLPQLVSTNLVDENNSGGYYNTNNNGFKRNKNLFYYVLTSYRFSKGPSLLNFTLGNNQFTSWTV